MKWKILDTGRASAAQNMAIDRTLLRELEFSKQPILHLYAWEGSCITYGHFLDPYQYLNREAIEKYGIELSKRPTGGGIVFHLADFAYSILIPSSHPGYSTNTLENYAYIHHLIVPVIQKALELGDTPTLLPAQLLPFHPCSTHFCMAHPVQYDVMWRGKKIAGGAQRRTKHGFLHQGTISLGAPSETILNALLVHKPIKEILRLTALDFESKKIQGIGNLLRIALENSVKRIMNG